MITDPSLDALTAHWRTAFTVAADALADAGSLGFEAEELESRRRRLSGERETTARLLGAIAHEEHVQLHRPLSAPRATRQMLGLPPNVLACVFDLDGVLTGSAAVHSAAWADTFDEFLSHRLERAGERFAAFRPFNPTTDYYAYLHGKPRVEGIHAFLAGRGIRLHTGAIDDQPDAETVYGLANRKNEALMGRLEREGVSAYADTQLYLEAAREAGLLLAVVSASANTGAILQRAGLAALIAERVDGHTIDVEELRSKPAPDTLLAACRRLGVPPGRAAAFETTVAGITAARTGGFGVVIAIDRPDLAAKVELSGADVTVTGLAALLAPALAA